MMNRLLFWKTAYGYQSVDMAMCFLVKVEKDQKSWKLATENVPKYHSESVRLPLAKVSTSKWLSSRKLKTPQGPKWIGFMWRRVDSWIEREPALNMTDNNHDGFKKDELYRIWWKERWAKVKGHLTADHRRSSNSVSFASTRKHCFIRVSEVLWLFSKNLVGQSYMIFT